MKKPLYAVIASILCFTLSSCAFSKEKKANAFADYINALPQRLIDSDNFNLEYTFMNPANYGFDETLLELPFTDEQDYLDSIDHTNRILNELEEFDYTSLNSEQQLTYDVLKDNLERSLLTMKYYDLDNSYLGSFLSFQAQLPFLLSEYSFDKPNDLDSYFHILENSDKVFHQYAEIEMKRQAKGTGMSKAILDKTIQQCDNFYNSRPLYLIDVINQKIDAVSFLNDEEKRKAKDKNEDLLVNHLQQAYGNLRDELSLIDADDRDLGLMYQPNGKEYYEALMKQSTGLDMNIQEVQQYLSQKFNEILSRYRILVHQNLDLSTKDFSSLRYSSFTSAEETLHYLQTRITQDFPALERLSFHVSLVDDSMKDNFSPAAYLQSRIDSPVTTQESIIINGQYEDALFPTLMHEGYPGHMYQNVYYKSLQQPVIRYLLNYSGYSEGWATYVESYSSQYATADDQTMIEIYNLNADLMKIWMCRFDIGIHYEGWDRKKFKQQMEEIFGAGTFDDKVINDQYDIFLETPTNTLKYNLTYFQFQDLRKRAQDELKEGYNPIEFHDVILRTGPAPFRILHEQVDDYITIKQS